MEKLNHAIAIYGFIKMLTDSIEPHLTYLEKRNFPPS